MAPSSLFAIFAAWSSTLSFSLVGFVGTFITAEVFDLVGVWNSKDVTLLLLLLDSKFDEAGALGDDGSMDLVASVLPLVELSPLLSLLSPLSDVVVVVAVG